MLKFIYSEKATTFCEIFTLLLSYVVPVKSKVKISQHFVAFSEYINFMKNVLLVNHVIGGLPNIFFPPKVHTIRSNLQVSDETYKNMQVKERSI